MSGCARIPPADISGVPAPWRAPYPKPSTAPLPPDGGITPGAAPSAAGAAAVAHPRSSEQGKDLELDRSLAPPGGPAPKLLLPVPVRRKLKNGTPVLVIERHRLPVATIMAVWPTGAADDPPGRAGLAGLTADLLDEGAGDRGPLALAEELQRRGARLDSSASWDSTTVSLTTLVRELDPVLALMSDIIRRPAFAEGELERVRADRRTELLQERDSAARVADQRLAASLYDQGQRYGLPLLGSEAGLDAIGREDVVRWHAQRLRPDLATLIVVGDLRPDDVVRRLDQAFAGWRLPARRPALRHQPVAPRKPRRQVILVDRPGAAQTELRVGQPGPPRGTRDYFPLVVMNAILGGQFSSRLNLNLRERHGYTYGARTGIAFHREGGPLVAHTPVKTAVTEPSLRELLGELERIRAAEVEPDELRLAKDLLSRAMARAFETPPEVAGALAAQVIYRLPDDYFARYGERVEAVTAKEIRRVAQAHLDPARMSIVLVGDARTVAEPTRRAFGGFEQVDVTGRAVQAPTP